jgi:hypothetical protein
MKKNKSIKYTKQRGGSIITQQLSSVFPGMQKQMKSVIPGTTGAISGTTGAISGMSQQMTNAIPGVKTALESVNNISTKATQTVAMAKTNIKKVKQTYETVLFWYATVPMILTFIFGLIQFLIPIGIFILICEIIILGINGLKLGFYRGLSKISKNKLFKSLKPKKPKMIPHIWILLWNCLMGLINKKDKKKKKKKK